MLLQPFPYLAPEVLRPELSVAGDVLQATAEVGRDGLGPVGHTGVRFEKSVLETFCTDEKAGGQRFHFYSRFVRQKQVSNETRRDSV